MSGFIKEDYDKNMKNPLFSREVENTAKKIMIKAKWDNIKENEILKKECVDAVNAPDDIKKYAFYYLILNSYLNDKGELTSSGFNYSNSLDLD